MNNYASTAFSKEICARLRGVIARYDVNQADLALLCDVSQSQFSKIIRGTRPMTVDQLVVLCEALGVDIATLIADVEEFLSERLIGATPLRYVEDEERVENPTVISSKYLDDWGRSASDRLDVPASRDDVALAAYDDEEWQSRQEGENE